MLSQDMRKLVHEILQQKPNSRPSVYQILKKPFMMEHQRSLEMGTEDINQNSNKPNQLNDSGIIKRNIYFFSI